MKKKRCTKCKELQPISEFYKDPSGRRKDGYHPNCKKCTSKRRKKNYRNCKKADSEYILRRHLKARFDLTLEQYDKLFEGQDGVCAICGKPETVENKYGISRLCVDHDHITGDVRGLLCRKCNSLLGYADDDQDILLAAVGYLRR